MNFSLKADICEKGYSLSLFLNDKKYNVIEFYIDYNTYIFTLEDGKLYYRINIYGQIYVEDGNGDTVHILSLPMKLLEQFRCMKK